MDQQDTDDPHDWPDNMLATTQQTVRLLEMLPQTLGRIKQTPDFPKPAARGGHDNRRPLWLVKDLRQWEKTHCIYGNAQHRCHKRRVTPDPDHLSLCREHRNQARRILNRKDNQ